MAQKSLQQYIWKISIIAKIWKEIGWIEDEEKEAEKIRREFPKILKEKFKMSEKEIGRYKSESAGKGSGQYIFAGNYEVPLYLKSFLDIFDKHKYITAEEKRKIYGYLVSFLPTYQSVKEFKDAENNYDEIAKEIKLKFEFSDLGDYYEKQDIKDGVQEFYLESRTWGFFEERIFFKVDAEQFVRINTRRKIYGYEYKWVENWKIKWEKIMDKAVKIRKLERFDNGYEICHRLKLEKEVRQKFYEEGACGDKKLEDLCQRKKWIDSATLCDYLCSKYPFQEPDYEANTMSKEKCLEKCKEIVIDFWESQHKKIDEEDFDYMKGRAFEELEDMRSVVERKYHKEICELEIGEIEPEELDELYAIREKADKAREKFRII